MIFRLFLGSTCSCGARRATGLPTDAPEAEFEETPTLLAAQEYGTPERFARHRVRRLLHRARERPA